MQRIGTVTTKVRPVKKLFVINPGDETRLREIVKLTTEEIGGVYNLILLNDGDLFSRATARFVERNDPDVIVNYSDASTSSLSQLFRAHSYEDPDTFLKSWSTPLCIWDQFPQNLSKYRDDGEITIYYVLENGAASDSLFSILNYGLGVHDLQEGLERTIFSKCLLREITDEGEAVACLREPANTRLPHLAVQLSGISGGSSIYHVNHNRQKYFDEGITLVIGARSDLKSVVYFWNTRAVYASSNIIWMPTDLLAAATDTIREARYAVWFSDDQDLHSLVNETNPELIRVTPDRFYYDLLWNEWQHHEFTQNVAIVDSKMRVSHPHDRLFSGEGYNINMAFEISGLEELALPRSVALGKLFSPPLRPGAADEAQRFTRVSGRGVSLYAEHFEPLEQQPIIRELTLPPDRLVFQTLFEEQGLSLEITRETALVDRVLHLLGGIEGVAPICNLKIVDLLVKLTPPRAARIARELRGIADGLGDDDLLDLIQRKLGEAVILNSDVVVDLSKMESLAGITAGERPRFLETVQLLFERNLILRGKAFRCPHCQTSLWYPLESLGRTLVCYGCNQLVYPPVAIGTRAATDAYRINELVAGAVDQGVLPVLLALHLLSCRQFWGFRYDCNLNVMDGNQKVSEIDLIFTIGRRLGLGELKAHRGFDEGQIDRLLAVAQRVGAGLLLFGTLLPANDPGVRHVIGYLASKNLEIPAFVLTQESLLAPKQIRFTPHFEVDLWTQTFPCGPILISPQEAN